MKSTGYSASDLRKRYGFETDKDLSSFVKENLEAINFDGVQHAKTFRGTWSFDETAVRVLDQLLGYQDEEAKQKAEERMKLLESENQSLSGQVEKLKETLQASQAANEKSMRDFHELQDRFIALQDGQKTVNATLLQKHQLRAEAAEKKAGRLQEKLDQESVQYGKQVKELEDRIEELQKKLEENHNLMEQKMKAEFEVLEARQNEDKIYKKLHGHETEIQSLKNHVAELKEEREASEQALQNLRQTILGSVNALENVRESLVHAAGDGSEETLPEKAAEPSASSVSSEALKEQQQREASRRVKSDLASAQHVYRQQLVEKLRKEQAEKAKEEKAEPASGNASDTPKEKAKGSFFHRAASFFGFM